MEEEITLQQFAYDVVKLIGSETLRVPVGSMESGGIDKDASESCNMTVVYLLNAIDTILAIYATGAKVPRPDYWFCLFIDNDANERDYDYSATFFPLLMKRIKDKYSSSCNTKECLKQYESEYFDAVTTQKVRLFTQYNGSSTCLALFILKNFFFTKATEQEILDRVLKTNFFGVNTRTVLKFQSALEHVLLNVHLITKPVDLIVDKERKLLGLSFNYYQCSDLGRTLLAFRDTRDLPDTKKITKLASEETPILTGKRSKVTYKPIFEPGEQALCEHMDSLVMANKPRDETGSNAVGRFLSLFKEDRGAEGYDTPRHNFVDQKWYLCSK